MVFDGSILNRPKIWLAGLQLFAANPDGVGLGNSGAIATAFLMDGIPEVRTMIDVHITLLTEFGWIVGWAWFAFIMMSLSGVLLSPRIGIAFAGMVLSACSSTIFDWPVLSDFSEQGGLGMMNWVMSWMMFAMFVCFGVWLIICRLRKPHCVLTAIFHVALSGLFVLALRSIPVDNAPQVHNGYVLRGNTPRTLALYDLSWRLKTIAGRVEEDVQMPIRGISEFPYGLAICSFDKVVLFGDCCEWKHLVKGARVECVER